MQTQIRWWRWALPVVLVGALVGSVGHGVSADDSAGETAADAKAGENPFEIADGTADELLQAMQELRAKRPQGGTRQEMMANYKLAQQAIVDAADRVLAQEVNDEQAAKAAKGKLSALQLLVRLGDEPASESLSTAIAAFKADKRAAVASEAQLADFQHRMQNLVKASPEEQRQFIAEVRENLQKRAPDREALGLAFQLAQSLERGDPKQAGEVYQEFAKMFASASDPDIREYAAKMEGSARRLMLPGQFMEIEGTLVNGEQFDWSAYRGKVVLVDFWATWCGPCRAELPNVKKNYEAYHDRGFDVVGISLDQDRQRLEEFLTEEKLPWSTLFSDDSAATGWNHPLATHYGIMAIPAVFLVDKEGKVVSTQARGEQLGQQLERLLGPAPAAQ